jgi:outer membrane protein assembly factor BamE (lipoprotein component of BamABCDE complex)
MRSGSVFVLAALWAIALQGCATFPDKQELASSPLTAGNISLTLNKGVTTKADVLKAFGAPNIVTKNRAADEVWNYNRMNYTTRVGQDGGSLVFWGGSRAVATATTKSFDLMVIFDANDIVKDYSIIQASF